MTLTVGVNIWDIKVDFLSINPSEQTHTQLMHLFYPPPTSTSVPLMYADLGSGELQNPENLSVEVFLQYNGILAEGTPVKVYLSGFVYPNSENTITGFYHLTTNTITPNAILVGFEGASLQNASSNPFSTEPEIFLELEKSDKIIFAKESDIESLPVAQVITWHTEGDYSPYIVIPSGNINKSVPLTIEYPNNKIHVSGSDIIQQEKYSRINTWLTIVLFFFTLIISFEYLYKLNPELISKILGIERCEKTEYDRTEDPQKDCDQKKADSDKSKNLNKLPYLKKKHR